MRLLRRRTARLRLTALYGVLFLVTGAGLVVITNGLFASRSSGSTTAVAAAGQGNQATRQLAQANDQIRQLRNQLAAETAQTQGALSHDLLVGSLVAFGIMALVSLVLGWVVASWVLRPLRMMTAATRRISAENLHERLAVPGPVDEVKDLADTIDGLLGRLEGAFAAQRRFVANASHELRTPLATMRASLDVVAAKPGPVPRQTAVLAGRVRTELDRVDELLEGLLMLARAQHGDLPGQTVLSLDAVVSAALAARGDAAEAKGLTVRHASGPDGAWVRGSQALVCRMIDNVIDNAIVHNDNGGWIRVVTDSDGLVVSVVVETGGAALDQRQVEQLAQPFRRLGADRMGADRIGSDDGAGLGLSIVAAIAAAHGGTLDLSARPEGGLRAGISLPSASASASAPAGVTAGGPA